MRRAARTDANQPEIVAALRAAGATVQSLATVGDGCPDLLVGYRGANLIFECKDGAKSPGNRKLTDDQVTWICAWNGAVVVVLGVDDALAALRMSCSA